MQDSLPFPFGTRAFASRLWLVILSLSLLAPALLFGWMAWQQRQQALAQAEDAGKRTVWAIREHALKVFDLNRLLLHEIERALSGRDWDSIEADGAFHQYLRQHADVASHIGHINLVDATGRLRASSLRHPVPAATYADRDYFIAHREGRLAPYISKMVTGRLTGENLFVISIPRTANGAFDGVLSIAVPVEHFVGFWEQFAPDMAHVIPMVREDGEVLARYPARNNPERLAPDAPFVRRFGEAPRGFYTAVSQVDGVERLNAYAKVGSYPIFVSFSVEKDAVLAAWRHDLLRYGLFALLATAALLALVLLVLRQSARDRATAGRWQAVAAELEDEMARRKVAEKQLYQAQKMEALGQLTGGVAHDFNNILQVVSTNLHVADAAADAGEARLAVVRALSATERGAKLTRQLLGFSRRQPVFKKRVDVAHLVRSLGGLLRATLGPVRVQVHATPGTWPALVDETQLEMALLNLAVNARDAMPGGGAVTIRTDNVHVPAEQSEALALPQGDYVLVSVIDDGVGMPPEVAERALEPFFTTKEIGKGTGLGLSQVHSFVAESGGGMSIETAPGAGTTIRLYLPKARETDRVRVNDATAVDPDGIRARP